MYLNSVVNTNSKSYGYNGVNFKKNKDPQLLTNELKALLSQDIWSDKLAIRMPQSAEEKDVLLEILTNRLKLDKLIKLTHEKFKLLTENNFLSLSPKELKKNEAFNKLEAVNKSIELEKSKNKTEYDYLVEIGSLSDELVSNHKLSIGKMQKFWDNVIKNNINKDGQISTSDIIEIIKTGEGKIVTNIKKASPLSKKQLVINIKNDFEKNLQSRLNLYSETSYASDYNDVNKAKEYIMSTYSEALNKYPEIKDQLPKIYDEIVKKVIHKFDRIDKATQVVDGKVVRGVNIYSLDKIWKTMDITVEEAKQAISEIKSISEALSRNPKSADLKEKLKTQIKLLNKAKDEWIEGLEYSIKLEKENRARFERANVLAEYDYIVAENPVLNRYKEIHASYQENKNTLPDDIWQEILS